MHGINSSIFLSRISTCFNELSVSDVQLCELSESMLFEYLMSGYSFLCSGIIFRGTTVQQGLL